MRSYFVFILVILVATVPVHVAADLDLKEANVVGVAYDNTEDSTEYKFDVTLYHDDDGEAPNYADLWIVEDMNGSELIRRELLHSHGTQEFTRSASGEIPTDISYVVVRAHDQTHDWGGQVALINLDLDSIIYYQQGAELENFTTANFPQTAMSDSSSRTSPDGMSDTEYALVFVPILVVVALYYPLHRKFLE